MTTFIIRATRSYELYVGSVMKLNGSHRCPLSVRPGSAAWGLPGVTVPDGVALVPPPPVDFWAAPIKPTIKNASMSQNQRLDMRAIGFCFEVNMIRTYSCDYV